MRRARKRALQFGILAIIVASVLLLPSQAVDWPSFYAAGRVRENELYSLEALHRETFRFTHSGEAWAFLRPPIYALAWRPLAALSPQWAFSIWIGILAVTIAVALKLLWDSWWAFLVVPSCGLAAALRQGQDISLWVLAAAGMLALVQRKRWFWAGVGCAALVMLKAHLCLPVALALLLKPFRRMIPGVVAGVAAIYLGSVPIAGWTWPVLLARHALENERLLLASGVTSQLGFPVLRFALSLALGGLALWKIRDHELALATVVALGFLAAPRCFSYDLAVVTPATVLWLRALVEDRLGAVLRPSQPVLRCPARRASFAD